MQLFALVLNSPPLVQRVELSQSVQSEVQQIFHEQSKELLSLDAIPFDGSHTPESDEVSVIADFEDPDHLLQSAANPLSCPIFDPDVNLSNLYGLFVVSTIDAIPSVCVQIFDRRQALTSKKFALIWGQIGQGFHKLTQTGMVLDSRVALVIHDDKLYFKSFAIASRIFDLTDYYHEATDVELTSFAGHDLITAPAAYLDLCDSKRIRKQIALILKSEILETVKAPTIVKRAANFDLHISMTTKNGKKSISLPDNRAQIKDTLDFLLENFYKGVFTKTTYVSNSRRQA
jgi:hypothetical protein